VCNDPAFPSDETVSVTYRREGVMTAVMAGTKDCSTGLQPPARVLEKTSRSNSSRAR